MFLDDSRADDKAESTTDGVIVGTSKLPTKLAPAGRVPSIRAGVEEEEVENVVGVGGDEFELEVNVEVEVVETDVDVDGDVDGDVGVVEVGIKVEDDVDVVVVVDVTDDDDVVVPEEEDDDAASPVRRIMCADITALISAVMLVLSRAPGGLIPFGNSSCLSAPRSHSRTKP